MDVEATRGPLRFFDDLEDPRIDRTKRHSLPDMILIAICAVICGADGWAQVEQFGQAKLKWFRTFLDLPNGIPSHDTFGRVFARLDPQAFEACFLKWVRALADRCEGMLVAIDGKTLRGSLDRAGKRSALHMINAWCGANHLVLGQLATEAKSNESTAIPRLLELLDLTGAVVSIDAMGCQKRIAGEIVAQGADYILQVKGNQPELQENVALLFEEGIRDDCQGVPYAYAESVDGGHGRVETRRVWTSSAVQGLADPTDWAKLRSVVCVEAIREIGDQRTCERRYYISSLDGRDAERMSRLIRGHWGVENQLHWSLDVNFAEDACRVRTGHAAENFGRLRRIAHNLLKNEISKKVGIKTKRLCCGWDHNYLLKVLTSDLN